MGKDLLQIITKVSENFNEEGIATKDYANLAHELRQLGFTEAAGRISEISAQEAVHAGILAGIAEELMQANCKCGSAGKLQKPIQDEVLDTLFFRAVQAGDRFRQWLYPNLPKDYAVNPEVFKLINEGITNGHSAQEIADSIRKAHS